MLDGFELVLGTFRLSIAEIRLIGNFLFFPSFLVTYILETLWLSMTKGVGNGRFPFHR